MFASELLIKFVTNRQLTYVGQYMLVLHVTVRVELLISITNCISLSRSATVGVPRSDSLEHISTDQASSPVTIHHSTQLTQWTKLHSLSKLINI
jgi:hypothetical protein